MRRRTKRGQTENLEVSDHPLDQVASLHVPAEQFLPFGGFNNWLLQCEFT